MDAMWQVINYGWLFISVVAQILRLGLCTLVVMLLGPLAALYVYDVGLYTWRVVLNRGNHVGPGFGPDQRALEDPRVCEGEGEGENENEEQEACFDTGSAAKPASSAVPAHEASNSPYSSDTDWDSITATSPAEFGNNGEREDHSEKPSENGAGPVDLASRAQPRFGGIQGSFTKLSDFITVTISAGAGDSAATVENYEREVKLVSGRS
ncbi:LAME_0D02036g1_1 [Lachancea meyersii CBS 8951]|uniref:LAME_0D02036g1_1 n=1 Tax=Lachancea meyersii CBS 8951 TaxID=1266667 RepID=A0A1G4J775_9SACH|nr:LAME_0D02036g1_1 [Lachancea meyersii CBS 8951]